MYGLDINFLKDRPEYRPETTERRRGGGGAASPESRRPLLLGLLAAVALLGATGGAWFFLQNKNNELRQEQAQLEAELGKIKAEQAQLATITSQTQQIQGETAALAGVFNAIKPWSALFSDISNRTPPRVRIVGIKELERTAAEAVIKADSPSPSPGAAPSPSPAPGAVTPPPSGVIEIAGTATSFNDVNDYLLVLQKSKFLKPDKTRILKAELGQAKPIQPVQVGNVTLGGGGGQTQIKLPAEVEFTIQTVLTDVPASELLQELERNKATGLVTRIETLQQKGVVK